MQAYLHCIKTGSGSKKVYIMAQLIYMHVHDMTNLSYLFLFASQHLGPQLCVVNAAVRDPAAPAAPPRPTTTTSTILHLLLPWRSTTEADN